MNIFLTAILSFIFGVIFAFYIAMDSRHNKLEECQEKLLYSNNLIIDSLNIPIDNLSNKK